MAVGQVPYPFWARLFSSGEFEARLVARGFDPRQAAALEGALAEILDIKQYEEEANYRFFVELIEDLQEQIDALDTRVTALEP